MYWLNGEAHHNKLDRGLQFGDGHFTTLRVQSGQPLWWDYHQRRLTFACEHLAIAAPDWQEIHQQLLRAVTGCSQGVAKIIVTRGEGGRGYLPDLLVKPNVYITTAPLPPLGQAPITLSTAELKLAQQPALAGLKTLNRLEQVLLANERIRRNSDDLLVLDQQNYVIETCQGNLFWRVGDSWYTPSLEQTGIAGVARQVILNKQWLGEVIQGDFTVSDLQRAEQAFSCNSVRGAVPIGQLNGRVLPITTLPEQLTQLIK